MYLTTARKLSLFLVALALPACATSRSLETSPGPASTSPPVQAAAAADNSPGEVAQVAYQEPSEVEEAPPAPQPLPEPTGSPEAVQPQRMTLSDLEQIALSHNPSLSEAWGHVSATRGKWVQAGLPPNFRIGYSGQQLSSHGQAEQQGVYLEQEFITGGKLRLNREVASREILHAEQLFAAQRRRILTDVRIGYYRVLCAQRRLETAEELVRVGNEAADTADRLFEQNEVSRRDFLQARIEGTSANNILVEARNQHAAAWRELTAILGMPQMCPMPLEGDLDSQTATIEWEQALDRLRAESPEISAAYAEVERAQVAVRRAHVERIPDVNVQGVMQYDNSTGSSNGSLLVSMPVPLWNRNQGGIREAQGELVAAEQAAQRIELSLQHRLAPVYARYMTGRQRMENFSEGILEDAQESLELAQFGYNAGELDYLDLLTAQRTFYQANLQYLDALCDMWTASAEINGLLLSESLERGPADR